MNPYEFYFNYLIMGYNVVQIPKVIFDNKKQSFIITDTNEYSLAAHYDKKYKEEAIGIVDLEYYKFKYKRKEYTQLQLIDRVIELTDEMLTDEYWDLIYTDAERLEKIKDEVFDIFKLIYGAMWW